MSILLLIIYISMTAVLLWSAIVFVYSWWNGNTVAENDVRLNGFEALPTAFNYDSANIFNRSCSGGLLLDTKNPKHIVDCSEFCDDGSDQQYEHKIIEDGQRVIVNRLLLKPGSWCLPKEIARCNLNVSYALSGINGYECRSIYPEVLGGITGNQIVGCAPFNGIVDYLEKKLYMGYVSPYIQIGDINERLVGDGQFRYRCYIPTESLADYMPLSEMELNNRFQLTSNVCGAFDPVGRYNIESGNCICRADSGGDTLVTTERRNKTSNVISQLRPCSTCTSGYGVIDETLPQKGSRYGISIGIDCVDPDSATRVQSLVSKVPCGLNILKRIRDKGINVGCQRALIQATGSYSPASLQDIDG